VNRFRDDDCKFSGSITAENLDFELLNEAGKKADRMRTYIYNLFLFHSARNIGLRQCLAIRGSCFSFLDPLDIW
jgi:hypothetical protein